MAAALPGSPWPPFPSFTDVLFKLDFDDAYYQSTNYTETVATDYGLLVSSWSGYALDRSTGTLLLPYLIPGVDNAGKTNIACGANLAAIRFWVNPNWSSGSLNGTGPGAEARLLELDAIESNSSLLPVWWLDVTADGNFLILFGASDTGPVELLRVAITWVANSPHQVVLNYGVSTMFYVDGVPFPEGSSTPAVPPSAAVLVLGSSSNGSNPAQAAMDDFYSFADQLPREDLHYFEYQSLLLPVITDEQPEQQQPKAERGALVGRTSGFRGPLVGSFSCGTNTSVWFTNLAVTNIVGQGATFSFSVAGGTNGVAYSLYRSINVGAPFISTNWQWLQYVHACDSVQLTNQGPTEFYLLAGEKDSDGDGMPDSWEVIHGLNPNDPSDALADPDSDGINNLGEYLLGTDPRNPDSDYDGICDGQELADGTNPLDPESVSPVLLGSWRFDTTNWFGLQNQAPITSSNLALMGGVSLNAVSVNSTNPAWLTYADTNGYCYGNINLRKGSLRMWFKSGWNSSTTNNGTGPQSQARLVEVGTKDSTSWWALTLDANGTNLSFYTPTGAGTAFKTNLNAAIRFTSNDWRQVVLTWSTSSSACYLDGQPANTNGSGVSVWPDASVRALGFRIGSDGGTNQARGRFDNLQTYNYVLSAAAVAAGYSPPCWSAMDVMLVTDTSGSMSELMSDGVSKLTAAKQAGSNFITHLNLPNNDQVGLVSFTDTSVLQNTLTNNGTAVITKLFSLSAGGNTRIDYGITNAQGELTGSRHHPDSLPVMVVLTDGSNQPAYSRTNVPIAASNAISAGIRLMTVALGTNADTSLLQQIASSTNYAYAATNSSQLNGVYDLIANSLCRLSNLPPTVSITSPTNNQSFNYPATINISATASDPQDGLVRVDFYGGTNYIGSDYYSPFAITWTGAQLGTNIITAIAYNEFGLSSTSTVSVVLLSVPPTVQITTPTNGQVFIISPTNISITVTSSVPGGNITNLALFNGAAPLFNTNTGSCQFLWTNVVAGTNTISAVANDNHNRSATNSVTIIVNAMPAVTLISPTNIQTFRAVTNVALSATAHDPDGDSTITQVNFYSGTNLLGTGVHSGTNWTLTWSNRPAGYYPVTAVATDNRGASGISQLGVFKVIPTNAPTVAITLPTNNTVILAGTDLRIVATATETNGTVTNVDFFQNGVRQGGDSAAPYELVLQGLEPGSYHLQARAIDAGGIQNTSTIVTVTVQPWQPLPAEGYWDPGYHPTNWGSFDFHYDSPFIIAIGASNEVYGSHDMADAGGQMRLWQSCGWTVPAGLGSMRVVHALTYHNTNLFIGGDFGVTNWDGAQLTDLTFGLDSAVYALQFVKGQLFAGGNFTSAGTNSNVQYIAQLVGNTWMPVGNALNGPVRAIASIGDDLYIGGEFTAAGGDPNVAYVAKLSGTNWVALGTGVTNTVRSLAVWNRQLLVGGDFIGAGGDTNGNSIAVWNGSSWSMLGVTLFESDPFAVQGIATMAVRGNDLFVGGTFDSFQTASIEIPCACVAHARWDERDQTWVWSAMDYGVSMSSGGTSHVDSLALRQSPTTNAVDVIAGGWFDTAGSVPSLRVARWVLGNTDCTNHSLPSVYFTSPLTGQSFGLTNLTLTAFAQAATTNSQISTVSFSADGTLLGNSTDTGPSYSLDWQSGLTEGTHRLDVVAKDTNGLANSATIYVTLTTNGAPSVNPDQFIMFVGDPPATLNVLTNDVGVIGIKAVNRLPGDTGVIGIAPGGKSLIYEPATNAYGSESFYYTATNSSGAAAQALVTVTIVDRAFVQITSPPDGASANASSTVLLSGNSFDRDAIVTNVSLFLNSSTRIAQTNNPIFTFAWSTNVIGAYTFTAVATDNSGYGSTSAPVTLSITNASSATNTITAVISNLAPTVVSPTRFPVTNYPVVRQGLFDLLGQARNTNGNSLVTYQLLVYPVGNLNIPAANVTPQPRDSFGFHLGGDTNGDLGTLDFSTLDNGVYDLVLTVRSAGRYASTTARFQLATQLKIGQFSFSEQDVVLPVNGMPVTITRTYNSLRANGSPLPSDGRGAGGEGADFGPGWTFAINSMDVQLDDERQDVTIGTDTAPFADDEEDENNMPRTLNIRTGGGWDVTLTLPDGRRTTFAFNPSVRDFAAYAQWTPPPDVHASLGVYKPGSDVIDYYPSLHWRDSDNLFAPSTFDNHDIPGWVLTNWDGTTYFITRGQVNNVVYDYTGNGNLISVPVYGPPKLTSIVQRTGDRIDISDTGIAHYAPGAPNATRSTFFDRDTQGRITAIHDPISGSNGLASVKYVYNKDTGNLLQVLKLVDRTVGSYITNKYYYDNSNFPHYITSIENPLGVPVARNYYDDSGRLIAVLDAQGNTTQFIHSTTNQIEKVIDRLNRTNTFAYDLRGNLTASTNALGGISLSAYGDQNNKTNEIMFLNGQPYATNRYVFNPAGFLLASYNPLGFSNTFAYNQYGQATISTDARGFGTTNVYSDSTGNLLSTSDALGNQTSFNYTGDGLLDSTTDPLSTVIQNIYDDAGNLVSTATLVNLVSGNPPITTTTIVSTNSFGYDANGNRTKSVIWRTVGASWVGATNTYILDAQNRVVQTIEPDGGTNRLVYDPAGKQQATIDKLGRVTSFGYDSQGRLIVTTNADLTTTSSAYDSNGNRTNSVDQLGRVTTYVYDALNRLVQAIAPDTTTNSTVYDDLGRVKFSVDARGTTNAFGYDAASRRVAITNAWQTPVQMTNGYAFDANGNQVNFSDGLGRSTTNVFDALNRATQVLYPDGTKISTGYDGAGRRVAETNQDAIVTLFGLDGAGRLLSVTNALGTTNQTVTSYAFDEAGNQTAQIDALGRTTTFSYDSLGRRIKRTLPAGQSEAMGYDLLGNLTRYTNFNGAVITNIYDSLNRPTNRASVNGYKTTFAFSPTGQRTNMTDASGTTSYAYDNRDRLQLKTVAFSGGPTISLNYRFDGNGNLTNLWSSSSGGVTNFYQLDALNRLTNALANGSAAAGYGFDAGGNLQTIRYGNGVTNQFLYDVLNRLTNAVWKTNAGTIASFYYQLGLAGNRTNLSEVVNGTSRTYAWSYDSRYRLKQETFSGGISGTLSYGFDSVANRTNRTVTGSLGLTNQSFTFNTNDWLTSDGYDNSGNTTNSSGNVYQYDPLNHATNVNSGAVLLVYDGDGNRMKKTAGSTTTYYLLDDRNPSGYVQVLEEWTASGGSTNLSRVYNYGLQLVSQRQPSVSTNYFVFDGHGSTRVLADYGGSVANTFTFDAYGNLIASNAAPQTVYLYCGQQWDPELGMYYNRARYYQSGIGRFWTMDTVEGVQDDPLSLHKYLYCAGNPVNNRDPSGQESLVELATAFAIGITIEALYATAVQNAAPRFETQPGGFAYDIEAETGSGFWQGWGHFYGKTIVRDAAGMTKFKTDLVEIRRKGYKISEFRLYGHGGPGKLGNSDVAAIYFDTRYRSHDRRIMNEPDLQDLIKGIAKDDMLVQLHFCSSLEAGTPQTFLDVAPHAQIWGVHGICKSDYGDYGPMQRLEHQ